MKKIKGSVLVYSLIVMFVMLSIVLAMTAVSINDRNNAMTTGDSVQAFQTANSGSELFTKALKASPAPANVTLIDDVSGSGLTCGDDGKLIGSAGTGSFVVSMYDNATPNPRLLNCRTDNSKTINDIAKIQVNGTYGGSTRAIEVAMAAGDQYQAACAIAMKPAETVVCCRMNQNTGETMCTKTTNGTNWTNSGSPWSAGSTGRYGIFCTTDNTWVKCSKTDMIFGTVFIKEACNDPAVPECAGGWSSWRNMGTGTGEVSFP